MSAVWKRGLRVAAWMLAMAAFAPAAQAAPPCAGFVDVDNDGPNGFCPSVEWIKNRGVTTGCSIPSSYCPNDAVIRLSMAAFMKRLGDALTPVQLVMDLRPGALTLDSAPVICQTADYSVTGFPRTAYADATVSASAPAEVSFAADLVWSTDGGGAWMPLNANPNFGSAPANQYGTLSDVGFANLAVTTNVRFGIRVGRMAIPSAVNISDSRCQLRVLIYSRTGTSSPY